MNKINNKGLTIVELIVSITLISLVMLFMYRMLSAITFEKDNDFIATQNQEQRIEIIDTLEKTYRDAYAKGTTKNLCLLIENIDNKGYITLKENQENKYKWEIKGGKVNIPYKECHALSPSEDICTFKIMINTLHDKNSSGNNNILDDIIFTYYTNDSDYNPGC